MAITEHEIEFLEDCKQKLIRNSFYSDTQVKLFDKIIYELKENNEDFKRVCPKCSKGLDKLMDDKLKEGESTEVKEVKYTGWICPKCGGGNGPFSSRCPCVGIPFNITC